MMANPDQHWLDLICPRNYERRKIFLRLTSRVTTLLEADFRKTNELIRCMQENLPGKQMFAPISIDYRLSVSDNCLLLRTRLHEIDDHLTFKKEQLVKLMNVQQYNELMNTSTSFQNKLKAARQTPKDAVTTVGSVPGMVMVSLLCEQNCLANLMGAVFALSMCALGTMDYSMLWEGTDYTLRYLTNKDAGYYGTFMGHGIDENLQDITATLDKFEPATDLFTRTVDRVIVRIEG